MATKTRLIRVTAATCHASEFIVSDESFGMTRSLASKASRNVANNILSFSSIKRLMGFEKLSQLDIGIILMAIIIPVTTWMSKAGIPTTSNFSSNCVNRPISFFKTALGRYLIDKIKCPPTQMDAPMICKKSNQKVIIYSSMIAIAANAFPLASF